MKRILVFFCWLFLLGVAFLAYDAHRFLTTPGSDAPRELVIPIAPGATFDQVARDLQKAGAITDVARFRLLARYKNVLGKVRVGEYLINTGWTPEQVLWHITRGQPMLSRLSVREGLAWWETAREIEAQGFARYEDFTEVIHDPEFLREHAIPFANAEGFLYPETYLRNKPRVLNKAQAREVASSMVAMFWKQTRPLWESLPRKKDAAGALSANGARPDAEAAPAAGAEKEAEGRPVPLAPVAGSMDSSGAARRDAPAAESAPAVPSSPERDAGKSPLPPVSGGNATGGGAGASDPSASASGPGAPADAPREAPLTPADLDPAALRRMVILASLVEKETAVPDERARVAGVYANRMRLGMLLQCDPTIIYGVGESFSGAIRRSQLNDAANPYNTYVHEGLPPGPICSPGLEALRAAAAPERHDFLFFVATGLDGGHSFSKTVAEHNKAVRVYRSRMREED